MDSKSTLSTVGVHGHKWRIGDSNPSPPPCKGGALPNELIPHKDHNGSNIYSTVIVAPTTVVIPSSILRMTVRISLIRSGTY